MAEMATYALPVYQAVVCSLTLPAIEQEDLKSRHVAILKHSTEVLESFRNVIDLFSRADFSQFSAQSIEFISAALVVLLKTGRDFLDRYTVPVDQLAEEYRSAYRAITDEISRCTDRIEDIGEAWSMATEQASITEIKSLLQEARKNRDEATSDWRDDLASIYD